MKLSSAKKFSLLGLVLLSASAIMAAILPSKPSADEKQDQNGRVQASTNAATQTCITEDVQANRNCFNTESFNGPSATTGVGADSNTATPGNTTQDDIS